MPHPQMFDDDDPVLARVRELALRLPEAGTKISHGRPAFFSGDRPDRVTQGKVFAYYGGSERRDGPGGREWVAHDRCVMVLLDDVDRQALLDDERTFVPAYLGPSGWLGVDLDAEPGADDWDEVAELLDASYRRTATRRLVGLLDPRGRLSAGGTGPGGPA